MKKIIYLISLLAFILSAGSSFMGYETENDSLFREHSNDPASEIANDSNSNSFDLFVSGTWWDLWSQRCHLEMNVVDDETVQIEINWSSGAAYNTVWHITGKWDADTQRLNYENGIMLSVEYIEGQDDAEILRDYTDGTGYFYFKDGYLYWVDEKENAGADCYFEPPAQ